MPGQCVGSEPAKGDGEPLSAYVEVQHAMELLAGGGGIGYLLKSRIADVEEFLDALQRIARGGSVVDPALVRELVTARRREDRLPRSPRVNARCSP